MDRYHIQLNFLPLRGAMPDFEFFRRLRVEGDSRPDKETTSYSLPKGDNSEEREFYWIRRDASIGYTKYTCKATDNNELSKWALFQSLVDAAKAKLQDEEFHISDGFLEEISFVRKQHAEGSEMLLLRPYFLRETKQIGFLADYHFKLKEGTPFSRKVQQLSLSLDGNFRRNLDFYIDKSSRINSFVKQICTILDSVQLPGTSSPLSFDMSFYALPARQLRSKVYMFGNNRESRSQFTGLRDHGPLQALNAVPNLLFVFREQDRVAARTLAAALKGSKGKEKFSFPGFQTLFKSDLRIDSSPVILSGLDNDAMTKALEAVKKRRESDPAILPIVVLPEGDDNGYMAHKACFTHAAIPTQVCTLRVILDENALKWAIANIALQVFCKSGGMPWKVKPTTQPTLIVGISQSHKVSVKDDRRIIEKYFAFTVMTDNSGLFQSIQVLGEAGSKGDYLKQLRDNLIRALATNSQRYSRVVIHTSFKLKKDEMDAIQAAVTEAASDATNAGRQFAVVKINHHSRFFGVNREVNSLVPYEGTMVRLGYREYLLWFEGIFHDKPTVSKLFPGPTHIQFLRCKDNDQISDDDLLQDLINLSGANWRGFNAKSAPVSVFYCHLVADLVHDFHAMGLPLPEVTVFRPWFL